MNKDAEPLQLNSPWPADSNSVFQTALDSLPNLFYLLDEQGRFVHWNLKSIEVTGYSDKEHLQMDILGLFAGKDQEHISNRMIEVFTKGEASAEAELVTKLGDKIPYYFTGKQWFGYQYLRAQGAGKKAGIFGDDRSADRTVQSTPVFQSG